MFNPLIAQKFLRALDGHSILMEQLLDAGQKINIRRAIIPPTTRRLTGLTWVNLLSQNRRTWAGVLKIFDTSEMVRNASRDLDMSLIFQS